jgi:hypothetical protein
LSLKRSQKTERINTVKIDYNDETMAEKLDKISFFKAKRGSRTYYYKWSTVNGLTDLKHVICCDGYAIGHGREIVPPSTRYEFECQLADHLTPSQAGLHWFKINKDALGSF